VTIDAVTNDGVAIDAVANDGVASPRFDIRFVSGHGFSRAEELLW
jgi:hypothetical protein